MRLGLLLVGICLAFGCDAADDPPADGSTSGPSATSTGDTNGSTGSTPETSGAPADPEAFCAVFADLDSCSAADLAGPGICQWVTITVAALEDDACVFGEEFGACVPTEGDATDPGCAVPEGCDLNPAYRVVDGQFQLTGECGTSYLGFEPCTWTGVDGEFDPPECGCLCEGGSGSTSDTGASSTGG